jgi:hypothetical protein
MNKRIPGGNKCMDQGMSVAAAGFPGCSIVWSAGCEHVTFEVTFVAP